MISARRTLLAITGALLLVVTAGISVWLMVSAGVFRASEGRLAPAPTAVESAGTVPAPGFAVTGGQVLQPRDPFRPLILPPPTIPTDTTVPGETTTTVPGETTTTVPGETTTTVPGQTTTTTSPTDAPDRIRVMLLEVRTEAGVRLAVIEVDDDVYTVGVGETFAGTFRVVSLTDNGGVFTHGDSAFTLAVGQSILK